MDRRVPVRPPRLVVTYGGLAAILMTLLATAACGPARPMRGYRPEVIGSSLGTPDMMPTSVASLQVAVAGRADAAADSTDAFGPATRDGIRRLVGDLLTERGYRVSEGRGGSGGDGGATVRISVRPPGGGGPMSGTSRRDDRPASGTARDWANVAVGGAARVQRDARLWVEAKGGVAPPPAGPIATLEVTVHGIRTWSGTAGAPVDSPDPVTALEPVLRVLVWHLPSFASGPVAIDPLAENAIVEFYRAQCAGRDLICPALPFPVRFPELKAGYHKSLGKGAKWSDTANSHAIERADLLAAFLHLVEKADRVLPAGQGAPERPHEGEVWEKATLVGEYVVDGEPRTLVVDLADIPNGYVVKECRVVDVLAVPALETRLADWENAARSE